MNYLKESAAHAVEETQSTIIITRKRRAAVMSLPTSWKPSCATTLMPKRISTAKAAATTRSLSSSSLGSRAPLWGQDFRHEQNVRLNTNSAKSHR